MAGHAGVGLRSLTVIVLAGLSTTSIVWIALGILSHGSGAREDCGFETGSRGCSSGGGSAES